MVSINLGTGMDLESIIDTFRMLITGSNELRLILSLLDPEKEYLMVTAAALLDTTAAELSRLIHATSDRLKQFHQSLPGTAQGRFELSWHGALPSSSAILIDAD